ncbi:putative RNA-directed DNA polymerase from transposon BS [Frankliniella fusca]|uniref:RNA-directed DNA polymerase from transposon BS n=1 Tax=Frankliniella fusca TaxID=407009 RepID=A0AAE1LPT5_9NEOP|nr:putative RNA-directed DNA polymerase from transposon BS [Frankliniella fusca]
MTRAAGDGAGRRRDDVPDDDDVTTGGAAVRGLGLLAGSRGGSRTGNRPLPNSQPASPACLTSEFGWDPVAFQTNDWAPPDRMTGQWEVEARQDDRGGEKQKEKFVRKSKRTVAFQTNDWAPPDRMTGQWEVEARQDDRGGEKQKEKFVRKSKRTVAFQTNDWAPPDRMTGQWEVEARQDDRGGEKQKEKFVRKRDVNEFCDKLDQCIQRVNAKKNQILLCGDFNIDILGYQTSVDLNGKKLMSILQENGLHSITNKSTRVTNMSRSAIDHIITNIDYKQYESKCDIETGLSDHYMQCISVNNVPTLGNSKPFIMRRVFTVKSKAAFCRAIKDQSWQEVFVRTDVNDKFNLFHDMFKKIYDTHFPVKKVRENLTDNKAWVTVGVKVTSRNYRDLCALIKTTNDPTLNSYFKRYRLIYRQVIKSAKCLHNQKMISNSKNKCKSIWSIINDNISKSKPDHKNMKIRRSEGSHLIENPTDISNIFNDYYLDTINDLQKNNPRNGTTTKTPANSSMFLGSVSQNEVINAIGKLKNKKCCGPDDITDEILKLCHQDIVEPLTDILNASFENGIFPNLLKTSKIFPLHKKGDEELVSNYRPVANLSAFSKIIEIVMAERVQSYLTHFNIIACSQFGFVKKKTTSDAEKLRKSIEEMTKWCNLNKLILNETKTSLVQFRTNFRTERNSNSAYFNSFTSNTKFLGIFIDDNLKWNKHIEELEIKLSKAIFAIRKIRDIVNEKTALMTYHALFHSILSYGVVTWGNSSRTVDIFKLQKKAIRAIVKIPQWNSFQIPYESQIPNARYVPKRVKTGTWDSGRDPFNPEHLMRPWSLWSSSSCCRAAPGTSCAALEPDAPTVITAELFSSALAAAELSNPVFSAELESSTLANAELHSI